MVEIESASVGTMRDERFQEVLDEINAKARQVRISVIALIGFGAVAALFFLAGSLPDVVGMRLRRHAPHKSQRPE